MTAKLEIGEEDSLRREPSAGYSEGKLPTARQTEVVMDKAWVGVDAGKEFHWAHVLDASGRQLLSQKIENATKRTSSSS